MTGATHVGQGKRTICDVILHSRVRINLQLSWIDRSAQFRIIFARIFALTVSFGVINMFRLD